MAGAPEERGRRLPRERRITRGPEIRALFKRGERGRTRHLDVLAADSPVPVSRAGLVVPRHGHTAVRRNRLKRRLREAVRTELLPRLDRAGVAVDVLVRARREAYEATFPELVSELVTWVERRWPGSS